jgi:hypothetical protein
VVECWSIGFSSNPSLRLICFERVASLRATLGKPSEPTTIL